MIGVHFSRPFIVFCLFALAAGTALYIANPPPDQPVRARTDVTRTPEDLWDDERLPPRAGRTDCDAVPLGVYTNREGTYEWWADVRTWHVDCSQGQEMARERHTQGFHGVVWTPPAGWSCDPDGCRAGGREVKWTMSYRGPGGAIDTAPAQP